MSGKAPYSTGFATGKINHELNPEGQMHKYKSEERDTHESSRVLPYELSTLPLLYAGVVDNAMQASKTLEGILREGKWENDPDLMKLKNNTDKALYYFMQTVDSTLDKHTIGGIMNPNEA